MFSNKKTREYEAREKTLQEEIGLLRDRCAALEAGKALADGRREKECGEREALRQEAERLRERCAGLQADNDRVYAGHRGLEEEINFLKYRIGTLDELHESVAFGYWPHDGSFRDYTCKYPFERIEILPRGEVYTCCSGYIKHDYYIGNIYGDHESFGEIWNSDRARKLRYSVQEGNFEFCQKKCRFFHMPAGGDNPITLKDGPSPRKGWQDFAVTAAPKYITLSCDESCNLQCPSCRSHAKALNKEDSDRLYDRLINIVRPMLRDCELLGALGTGELFASSALSRFFKTINAREFPKLSLIITTNLQLVNEAKWEEFSNLLEIPKTIRVSMDGASKGTYEENRRGGVWERMQENLACLCRLRKDPGAHVDRVGLNFVVQDNNYQEMEAFVAMAESLGVDAVEFQKLGNWGTFPERQYREKDIWDHGHPRYGAAMESLRKILEKGSRKVEIIQNII